MRKFFWGFVIGSVTSTSAVHITVRVIVKRYTGNWPDL